MKLITLLLPVGLVLHFCQGRPQTDKDVQSSPQQQQQQHVHASEGYKFKFATFNSPTHSTTSGIKHAEADEDISKLSFTSKVDSEHPKHGLTYGTDKDTNRANSTTTQFSPELAKQQLSESGEDTDDRIGTTLLISLSGTG